MTPLELVNLTALMERTRGRPDVIVAVMDGPIPPDHPDLPHERLRTVAGRALEPCGEPAGVACAHGTFVAGILCAKPGAPAPAICAECTLLVRPIFKAAAEPQSIVPNATPAELAEAITECVDAGARVLNLSVASAEPSALGERHLEQALDYAAARGVVAVAAAGNQGIVGSSPITRHRAVIPVVAYDARGRPMNETNIGRSIGRRGLGGPGEGVTSLGPGGGSKTSGGTSVAAPFVTATVALLWSAFPAATSAEIRVAMAGAHRGRRHSVVPPLLDAWAGYETLARMRGR